MNCQKFEDLVTDIAREQIIDASLREAALRHSDDCDGCAARLAGERALTLDLRDLLQNLRPAEAPLRVEAKLMTAFDERALVQLPLQVSARRYQARYLIGAIAAGLLIVFGVSAALWRRPTPVNGDAASSRIEKSGKLTAAITTTLPVTPPPPILVKTGRNSNSSRRKDLNRSKGLTSPGTRPASPGNVEIATDFMPLTYGATANLREGGRMVRVELPHSAMATFGLPVNMDRANERVKADVLFGVDGLAQAIRFVR